MSLPSPLSLCLALFVLLSLLFPSAVFSASSLPPVRVAIIGGGISGSSFSYFLHRSVGRLASAPPLHLTLFERSQSAGGRLQSTYFTFPNGTKLRFELGGSIIHASNEYLRELVQDLNLTRSQPEKAKSTMAIYDGDNVLFHTHGNRWYDFLSLAWYYGPWNLWKLTGGIDQILQKWKQLYIIQKENDDNDSSTANNDNIASTSTSTSSSHAKAFNTVEELLDSVGLLSLTRRSMQNFLTQEMGLESQLPLVSQLISSIIAVNYNQKLELNALAGAVGTIPLTDPECWAVEQGNSQVPQGLIQRYVKSARYGHTVASIEKLENGRFRIIGSHKLMDSDSSIGPDQPFEDTADYVIIATPLEFIQPPMKFHGFQDETAPDIPMRIFQRTETTFLRGQVNPLRFNFSSLEQFPGILVSPGQSQSPFSSMANYYAPETDPEQLGIYKLFTHQPIEPQQLSDWFTRVDSTPGNELRAAPWLAYPHFSVPEKFAPFRLYKGVYYINAFENAVSCMECMAVAAKNVALLVSREIQENAKPRQPIQEEDIGDRGVHAEL